MRSFSSCYDHDATQDEIYHNDVEPLLDVVYSGVVCFFILTSWSFPLNFHQTVTIFAYGVTSSGKTHTMQGTKLEPGVIPRVVEVSGHVLYELLFNDLDAGHVQKATAAETLYDPNRLLHGNLQG